MIKPKYFERDAAKDRWLVSYVDIVTILLILFVALASKSAGLNAPSVPAQTRPAPLASAEPKPAEQKAPLPAQLQAAERTLRGQGLDLRVEPRGVVIRLPQTLLFGSGQDQLRPESLPLLEKVAGVLRQAPNQIQLVGHADARPIHGGRFRNNWELSAARSLRLLELLTTRYGVPEERLSMAGRGAESPSGSNQTAEGRAANRRVEIVMLR